MDYRFSAANEALRQAGQLVQATTADGKLLPILRNASTGTIAEIAKATVGFSLRSIGSIVAPAQLVMGPIQMVQNHLGFQETYKKMDGLAHQNELLMHQTKLGFEKTYQMLGTLQSNVALLHATTAVIGIGTFAGAALSGVNLYQTLKIRKELKNVAKDVKETQALILNKISEESEDIKSRIDRVADDVNFNHHKTILGQAYGRFEQAVNETKNYLNLENTQTRINHLSHTNSELATVLADYRNPQIYTKETNSPARLRRYECAWQIEQAIAIIYILLKEFHAASNKMNQLRQNIRKDTIDVISSCQTEEELDFIYPELMRIYIEDIPIIEAWHTQVNYLKTASKEEFNEIINLKISEESISDEVDISTENELIEQKQYEALKKTSHFNALRDNLKFTVNPETRREHEAYIADRSPKEGYYALASSNWKEVPDMTVANLYWYLKSKENEIPFQN